MATTNFTDRSGGTAGTTIEADWLNDVNFLTYDVFNGKSSVGADGTILVSDGTKYVEESGATARTSLSAQTQGDVLDDLNTLGAASSDGEIIVATGAGAFAYESGDTARTSLGLGSGDNPTFTSIFLNEQASAVADVAGDGQFWVKSETPNVPMFTDDAGTDHRLGIGKHTIWIPASAMTPTVSNGCAALSSVETTAGRPDMVVLDFRGDTADQHAQFDIAMPKSWNEGAVTAQFFWTSTATDTDGVTWAIQGVACSDGDTIDVAYGTAITVDDANQSTAEDLYVTSESGAITIAGTPAEGDLCFFRVFRDISDANDTATEDARLLGVKLFITTDTATDD